MTSPTSRRVLRILLPAAAAAALCAGACAPTRSLDAPSNRALLREDPERYIERHYEKSEHMIPMRDGVRLHTVVYTPRDGSETYPFLLRRTPYSCRPYGPDSYPNDLPPGRDFAAEGFIFVYQDVRGAYMSEGEFEDMRPHVAVKRSPTDVDESTDTWDTIDWLVKNIPNNNGLAGMWGISYPGFYAAAGMIDAHPALVAVSPQAPIADWRRDDFFHNGALFLPHTFLFMASFGRPRPEPTTERSFRFDSGTPDGYSFFLEAETLDALEAEHYKGEIRFWNQASEHPADDAFWRARDILPHLSNAPPAVLTVGGWFDAEDLYGPLSIYRSVEERNPGISNKIVMGPWFHGGWRRSKGDHLGDIAFGQETSPWYQERIELPFFVRELKGGPNPGLAEATMFNTGANEWREFDRWPPAGVETRRLNLLSRDASRRLWGGLSFEESGAPGSEETYISDPTRPVPFTRDITMRMTREYMTEDQRFASRRPDVLTFRTEPLEAAVTLAGPLTAHLWVALPNGGDADFIVKLIDVFPPDAEDTEFMRDGQKMGEYQMMVRSESFRGRYRNDPARGEPFGAGEASLVRVPLQDVLHTFEPGHRIMVQVQSTWFPLIDRNPQKWVENIFDARPEDFTAQPHVVYTGGERQSFLEVGVLPE